MKLQALFRPLFFLLAVRPFLLVVLGLNVFGKQNLPKQARFIMVANHNSHLDTLALLSLFPLSQLAHIHPVAAEDYFFSNPVMAWFSSTILNIIPIPRTGICKSNNPLQRMCEALEAGDSLIIFPEGSRGTPEVLAPFKSGIAHLIQKFPNTPVIPVYLKGMGRSLPKGEFILVPFFCDVVIGRPECFSGAKTQIIDALGQRIEALRQDISQTQPKR